MYPSSTVSLVVRRSLDQPARKDEALPPHNVPWKWKEVFETVGTRVVHRHPLLRSLEASRWLCRQEDAIRRGRPFANHLVSPSRDRCRPFGPSLYYWSHCRDDRLVCRHHHTRPPSPPSGPSHDHSAVHLSSYCGCLRHVDGPFRPHLCRHHRRHVLRACSAPRPPQTTPPSDWLRSAAETSAKHRSLRPLVAAQPRHLPLGSRR